MRKRGLLMASFLIFLLAGLLARATSGFAEKPRRQDQPQRPEFYALGVVCEKYVQNAKDSLGAPDGHFAEILPGGNLVMLMENILLPSRISGYGENAGCVDSGSVVGKGEADFGLEGRFTWQDSEGDQHHEWIPLGPTATGFCISPPPLAICSYEDSAGVDMIRITNPGTKSLFVDAVIGYIWYPGDWRALGAQQDYDELDLFAYGLTEKEERRKSIGRVKLWSRKRIA